MRAAIKAQTAYLRSLETSDMFSPSTALEVGESKNDTKNAKSSKKDRSHPAQTPQATTLKATLEGLKGLHGKLYGDIPFAKREIAWGKLDAKDIDEIFTLFRGILIPLIGMSTITDIFERIAERRGWVETNSKYDKAEAWETRGREAQEKEKETWNEIMKTLHEPFEVLTAAMDEGLEHAGLVLELLPKSKTKKGEVDVEAKGDAPKPGEKEFSKYLEEKVLAFYNSRGKTLRAWARQKGLSEDRFDASNIPADDTPTTQDESQHNRDQQQLYLILYLEHLLYSTGVAVSKLIKFADKKAEEGTMKKNRLILPGKRRLKKWIMNIGKEDATIDTESPDSLESGANTVYLGAGFNPKKDPEHLPPETAWQHFGNYLRGIPHFLGSTESTFGFRVACATLSVGIIAFLRDTQTFFIEQRLVWAMIIIAIGMTMTSGQSIFGFFGRVAGTALSMVCCFIIWYIVDGKTPGVIVFL